MSRSPIHPNTLLLPIPAEKQGERGWKATLNGYPITPVESLVIVSKYGTLTYGHDVGGYDRWGFREAGGGGSVIVPYAIAPGPGNKALVGVVLQGRPGQGGKVWNVPRGFLDPGETHFQAAKREAGEEFDGAERGKIAELAGDPMNPNSTFFETCFEHQGRPAGVRFYSSRFAFNDLEFSPELNGWRVRPDSCKSLPVSLAENASDADKAAAKALAKTREDILGSRFIPWTQAVQLGDMFTVAVVGRLMGSIAT